MGSKKNKWSITNIVTGTFNRLFFYLSIIILKGCEDMLSIYTSYMCFCCKKEFILLSEELENTKGYLVCPYCSSRKIKKERITDNLKECMSHSSYKKIKGTIRQVR